MSGTTPQRLTRMETARLTTRSSPASGRVTQTVSVGEGRTDETSGTATLGWLTLGPACVSPPL